MVLQISEGVNESALRDTTCVEVCHAEFHLIGKIEGFWCALFVDVVRKLGEVQHKLVRMAVVSRPVLSLDILVAEEFSDDFTELFCFNHKLGGLGQNRTDA